jgi:hypothetical protein
MALGGAYTFSVASVQHIKTLKEIVTELAANLELDAAKLEQDFAAKDRHGGLAGSAGIYTRPGAGLRGSSALEESTLSASLPNVAKLPRSSGLEPVMDRQASLGDAPLQRKGTVVIRRQRAGTLMTTGPVVMKNRGRAESVSLAQDVHGIVSQKPFSGASTATPRQRSETVGGTSAATPLLSSHGLATRADHSGAVSAMPLAAGAQTERKANEFEVVHELHPPTHHHHPPPLHLKDVAVHPDVKLVTSGVERATSATSDFVDPERGIIVKLTTSRGERQPWQDEVIDSAHRYDVHDTSLHIFSKTNALRVAVHQLVTSIFWSWFIFILILLSCITLALENPTWNKMLWWKVFFNVMDYLFVVVFTLEVT